MNNQFSLHRIVFVGVLIGIGVCFQPDSVACLGLDEETRIDRSLGLLERPVKSG